MELRERRAHSDPQLRVEVRERLVHEERLRLARDRPPHRDPLALPAGQLCRLPLEQVGEAEEIGDLVHARAGSRPSATRRTFRP